MNPRFILCTSHADVHKSSIGKFGSYIVRIHNPKALLARIEQAWQKHPLASGIRSVVEAVVYDKDDLLRPNQNLLPPIEYSYCQKPTAFRDEREFRFVDAIKLQECASELKDYIELELSDCCDIRSLT